MTQHPTVKRLFSFITAMTLGCMAMLAQPAAQLDSASLDEVTVTHRRAGTQRLGGAVDAVRMGRQELFKAACCNLGESFTTNPSVDVNYTDAATGAKQIKLLGLSGTYVQMLSENLPAWRGSALPFALSYVPGPWMKSIQVSKGASSVRNGYESITGQIDVEYLKPEDEQGGEINLYVNSEGRIEANADANRHLSGRLNTEVLAHYEQSLATMDHNHDLFMDKPKVRQVNVQNRWDWLGEKYIFHGGLSLIDEKREGGQTRDVDAARRYRIDIDTRRYEGYMKHALVLDREHGTNIALMAQAAMHRMDADYGLKYYNVNEKNVYAQLMFETNVAERHNLSAGLSFSHDYLGQHGFMTLWSSANVPVRLKERENVHGTYAQYTFNAHERLVAMAGIRVDHSSLHGTFVTPRFHVKYSPSGVVSLRASAGKGYRTAHALAENHHLLATGYILIIDTLKQEQAWNYGAGLSLNIPLPGRLLKVNAEYYYTRFSNQAVVNLDELLKAPLWNALYITNLDGRAYSHVIQVDATCAVFKGLELTAAYRHNNVKTTYNGKLRERPFTSRAKALLTASYSTPLGLWQFDVTAQFNGSGRMPDPYYYINETVTAWPETFKAFEQINAQVTRHFRHFSIYVGGENLTGKRQHHPIIEADNPWSPGFNSTFIWGPTTGAMAYAGIRLRLGRTL